ncbi:Integrator complex subunit 11 [Echinococcus granulosus]|nr:Integrator complex subunit 11 [Echinococcus granulosus]
MTDIRVIPLGAGQDVGRSCILVSLGGKNIMLDCGMHMGYNDERRFPDFSFIVQKHDLTEYINCVIISHFHLDHCGALPYMTEMVGYNGPIYMTHPTKAICPILLDDYRRISVERRGEQNFFTAEMIHRCMRKVKCVYLHQAVRVDDEIEIQAFYAGHVLGAAIFHIKVGDRSLLYTGDYNMTPDRHLGAAWVPRCRPDLLITETTYATTIRDSKRAREREFLEKVHSRLDAGGKVLIPVFALGRAQELCILLETYWERMNLSFPIFFSAGMAEKATEFYKLFISWTSQKIKETFVERNMFDFKHVKHLTPEAVDQPGPMVVFATPGMLHAGQSLHIFRKWAPDPKNMVIIPGYCVSGTVGYKILNGVKRLEFDKQILEVCMRVEYLSFSAHADARGIMQLISQCRPGHVLLVHGEASKMEFLKSRIECEAGLECSMPANGEIALIPTRPRFEVVASVDLLKKTISENSILRKAKDKQSLFKAGVVVRADESRGILMSREAALASVGLKEHAVLFTSVHAFASTEPIETLLKRAMTLCLVLVPKEKIDTEDSGLALFKRIFIDFESPPTKKGEQNDILLRVTFTLQDEDMGTKIFSKLRDAFTRT